MTPAHLTSPARIGKGISRSTQPQASRPQRRTAAAISIHRAGPRPFALEREVSNSSALPGAEWRRYELRSERPSHASARRRSAMAQDSVPPGASGQTCPAGLLAANATNGKPVSTAHSFHRTGRAGRSMRVCFVGQVSNLRRACSLPLRHWRTLAGGRLETGRRLKTCPTKARGALRTGTLGFERFCGRIASTRTSASHTRPMPAISDPFLRSGRFAMGRS